MNKQNIFMITKVKKGLSLNKYSQQSKERNTLSINTIKSHQNQRNPLPPGSPSKKAVNEQFHCQQKTKAQIFEKAHMKDSTKRTLKLRILSQSDSGNLNKTSSNNTTKKRELYPQIQDIIEKQIIQELVQIDIIQKNNHNQFVIKPDVFTILLEKVVLFIYDLKEPAASEELACLNAPLQRIRDLANIDIRLFKEGKNRLVKSIPSVSFNYNYYRELKIQQSELEILLQKKNVLIQQIRELNAEKMSITAFNQQKKQEIYKQNQQITQNLKKIEDMRLNQSNLTRQIKQYQSQLNKCQKQYENIVNYVETQCKNKHIQQASKHYKELEQEIYDYAAYLQANQLATSETYESIPFKNQCFLINNLDNSLKEINQEIMQNETLPLLDKEKIMRNFIIEVSNVYKRKDKEYEKMLDFKTKCIRKFVAMMKKWLDNWTLKQEYLVNLRKQFAVDSTTFLQKIHHLFHNQLCSSCSSSTKQSLESLLVLYGAIQENYKLGNSFY